MSILNNLSCDLYWQELLQSKKDGGHLSRYEERELTEFIEKKEYLSVVEGILNKEPFALPEAVLLNKKHSNKKRTVFVFSHAENMVLKLLAFLLNKYDYLFPENLYSFRKNKCVKNAISSIVSEAQKNSLYSYKVDIHDYFNSIDTTDILRVLDKEITDDSELNDFIRQLLLEPRCIKDGEIITCQKGIMAGAPISGFLANLYLKEMDEWFESRNILYARYSDDIIVFAKTREELFDYECKIKEFLSKKRLTVNEKKEISTLPQQKWEFLGFSIDERSIDISTVSLNKIKDKMRRKARALLRWKKRSNATDERAIVAFIKHFNKKLYNNPVKNDITWCRWYFPTITTEKSLHEIDKYMLSCIRFIATGRHTKANYNLRYEDIKGLGYKSLVNAFFEYKKTGVLSKIDTPPSKNDEG